MSFRFIFSDFTCRKQDVRFKLHIDMMEAADAALREQLLSVTTSLARPYFKPQKKFTIITSKKSTSTKKILKLTQNPAVSMPGLYVAL